MMVRKPARVDDAPRVFQRRNRVHDGPDLRDQHEPVVLGEVEEVLGVEGREWQLPDQAARSNPGVVNRSWPAAKLGVRLKLTPACGHTLVVGQHDEPREKRTHGGQIRWSSLSYVRPFGQLTNSHEREGGNVAGKLASESVRDAPTQERRGDVSVRTMTLTTRQSAAIRTSR